MIGYVLHFHLRHKCGVSEMTNNLVRRMAHNGYKFPASSDVDILCFLLTLTLLSIQAIMSSPPTNDVGFVQQGQVDWVAFGRTVVPLSIDILARLQGAGVQAITYAGALQLTTCFKLPELGRQRLWDAINRLQVFNSASNLLYFGFAHRSFFRILTETVSGLKCIALCSCLAEMHTETVAARILSALWQEAGYPEDYEPSILQFKALVKACGGALASSPFPQIANRMFPHASDINVDEQCSEPKDIAKALSGLFDVSMGKKKSITVAGGSDCAFIAAVAHWVLNLDIYVEDYHGNVVFTPSVTNQPVEPSSAQVYIKYADTNGHHGLVVTQSTYLLNDPQDILFYTPDKQLLRLRRRVPWDRCLQDTFGKAFEEFKNLTNTVGNLLGSFARISMALAEGEVDVGDYRRQDFIDFAEASYGQGFIESSSALFPELSCPRLQRKMQSAFSVDLAQAQSYFEGSILALKRSCLCYSCTGNYDGTTHVCFQVLAATLIDLISTISSIQFCQESELYPTCQGIKSFYERNLHQILRDEGPLTEGWNVLFHRWRRSYDGNRYPGINQLGTMLEEILFLFTGSNSVGGDSFYHVDLPSKPRIAVCDSGICVFIQGMLSISTRADLLRRIHVINGRIGRSMPGNPDSPCREYDSVSDIVNWPKPTLQQLHVLPTSFHRSSSSVVPDEPSGLEKLEMAAEVVESGDAGEVTFFYRLSTPSGNMLIPPGKVTMGILENTGLIPCNKSGCPTSAGPHDIFTVAKGWVMDDDEADRLDLPMTICLDWEHVRNSEIGQLAAFSVQNQTGDHLRRQHEQLPNKTIVRRGECLPCCARTAAHLKDQSQGKKDDLRQGGIHRVVYHII